MSRLPDHWPLVLEREASVIHCSAARKILDRAKDYPPGSIGHLWALKILSQPLQPEPVTPYAPPAQPPRYWVM